MAPKDFVVFSENVAGQRERLALAAALAERWQTHLVAIFVAALPGATGLIGGTLTEMLRLLAPRWRMRGCGLFERLVANRGFTHEWRVAETSSSAVSPEPCWSMLRSQSCCRARGFAMKTVSRRLRPALTPLSNRGDLFS